jgi:hypothetical protein
MARPELVQACQRRDGVAYCPFAGYERWVDVWERPVAATLRRLPASAPRPPITVRQRVLWADVQLPRPLVRRAANIHLRPAPGEVTVGLDWGRGRAAGASWLYVASSAAASVLGLPPVVAEGVVLPPDPPFCGARAAVALWLAAGSDPGAAATLRATRVTGDSITWLTEPYLSGYVRPWGAREVALAKALLDRPDAEVRAVLERNWATLTAPGTAADRLGRLVGIKPPPTELDVLIAGGFHTREEAVVADAQNRRDGSSC